MIKKHETNLRETKEWASNIWSSEHRFRPVSSGYVQVLAKRLVNNFKPLKCILNPTFEENFLDQFVVIKM